MRIRILLVLLAGCLSGISIAHDNDSAFTLYLVRHAEKQSDGSLDPELTQAGRDRAEKLANWLQDKDIANIWSSDSTRTRDTAKPLAAKLGLDVGIYNPRDLPALAEQLRSNGHNALVAGHSNTTPELARLLCQCAIADMDESEYDRLIVISVVGEKVHARTLIQGDLFKP